MVRDAEASEIAAACVVSKASARVNVVEPLAATGIWATWSICPAVDACEYVEVSAWLEVSMVSPSLEVPT